MENERGSGSVPGREAGWWGGLHGEGYPDAGEQRKIMITSEQPTFSEPHCVLST